MLANMKPPPVRPAPGIDDYEYESEPATMLGRAISTGAMTLALAAMLAVTIAQAPADAWRNLRRR